MADTEWQEVVRDLRRRSTPGDAAYRAARWIEENHAALDAGGAGAALPLPLPGTGFHRIDQAAAHAEQYLNRREPPLAPDHAVRDIMTKETLSLLRQERDHELASEETKNDYEYIEYFRRVFGGTYKHVAKMIALTARFAGELPHDLINPTIRTRIEERLSAGQYADRAQREREVETAITNTVQGAIDWKTFADPGLVANADIACVDTAHMLPRLQGLTMEHVNAYVRSSDVRPSMFMNFFCDVMACTWRFNSVMAAQPYKTKYEHGAVILALKAASQRFRDYELVHDRIKYSPRTPPQTLGELIDRDYKVFQRD